MDERFGDTGADDPIERLRRSSRLFDGYSDEDIAQFLLQHGRTDGDRAEAFGCFTYALAIAQRTRNRGHEFQALCELGCWYGEAHEYDRAHELFTEALAIASETRDEAGVAACRLNQADTCFNQGDAGEALRLYERALASGSLNASSTVHACINQGRLLLDAERCSEGLTAFEQALRVAETQNDQARTQQAREYLAHARAECEPSLANELTLSLVASLEQAGTAAFRAGDFKTARRTFARGLALFRRLGHAALQAAALRNVSRAEAEMSAFSESVSHANLARELYEQLADADGIALCRWQVGDVARLRGDCSDALVQLTAGLRSLDVCTDLTRGCLLSSLGLTYSDIGHYRLALACHQAMYDLAVAAGDREALRISLNNLGLTWRYLGELDRAAACLREALELSRQSEATASGALCLNNLGAVYHAQRDLESAADCFKAAIKIDREYKQRRHEANHLANLGAVFAADPDSYDEAVLICQEAMGIARECSDRATLARCLTTLGRIAVGREDYAAGSARFREALEINRQLDTPSGVLPCLINLSAVAFQTGDYAEARSLAESAIATAGSTGDVAALEHALENHGFACLRLRDIESARRSLEEAIRLAERLRTLAGGTRRERMIRFRSLVKPYVALIEEILLPNGEAEPAFRYVERLKARTLVEKLAARDLTLPADVPQPLAEEHRRLGRRRRGLETLLGGDDATLTNRATAVAWAEWRDVDARLIELEGEIGACSSRFERLHDMPAVDVTDVQRSLTTDDTAMVELFMAAKAVYAFVITRTDGLRAVSIADTTTADVIVMAHRWTAAYDTFRRSHDPGPWFDCMDDILERLHRTVFAAVARAMPSGISNIVFVPHHAFHLFPLHAMCDARGGRREYLIDRFQRISYSPSASAFVACSQRKRPEPELLVAIENPTGDLLFAAREVAAVASMFRRSVILGPARREPANAERYVAETAAAHVVLIAGHASGNSESAALMLTDGAMSLGEQFAKLDVPSCSLWDFDACETGLPPPDIADEWLTLASAPLCAGAATVWSSLWVVDDEATCHLKVAAYGTIAAGKWSPAEALNDAQRAVLAGAANGAGGDQDYTHPYFWAGFISTGAI
jgi:tetratricopeptide (TPR) repeat protein